jgi:hypothetical protein
MDSIRAEPQRFDSDMLERSSNKSTFYQEDFQFGKENVLKLADKTFHRLHKIVVDGSSYRKH